MNEHLKIVLAQGIGEIRDLRRRNEILEAQMRVVEIFGRVAPHQGGYGMSHPDPAWEMQKVLDELAAVKAAPNPVEPPAPAGSEEIVEAV